MKRILTLIISVLSFVSYSQILIQDINPGPADSEPSRLTAIGSNLYFSAYEGTNGAELWKYDGTTAIMVQDINPGTDDSDPEQFTEFGSDLIFTANDGVHGWEVWKYDGTSAVLIQDINPNGNANPSDFSFTVFGSDLYCCK